VGPSLIGTPDIHNSDAIHPVSLHTQAYENNDLSSSIFVDPTGSQNSPGGKKPRAQASISGDPNRLSPSVRRDSLGGGNSSQTHEWDGDHGGVQDWINSGADYVLKRIMAPDNVDPHQHEAQEHHNENDDMEKASQQRNSETPTDPIVSQANPLSDYILKRIMAPERSTPINVDPHQHEAQEQHDDNMKKASQQRNSETYTPIVSQANPLPVEDENRAGRENVSKHDHHESRKAAGHGDRVKDSFEPETYYYIVPAGLDIIFQDEDGTEITRVGKTIKGTQDHASHTHTKNIPIVVQDIFGNELFRSNLDQGSPDDPNLGLTSPNHTPWKTVIVDEKGKQIPLKYAERNVG